MIQIQDYFDPKSVDHVKAFLHMQSHGEWPGWWKHKMEKDSVVISGVYWKGLIESKIVDAWIRNILTCSEYSETIAGMYKVHP